MAIIGAVVLAFVLGGAGLIQLAGSGATAFRLEGQVLHLSGPVNGAAADRLQRMLEESPQITVIALGDMAGADDVVWAAQMAGLIRAAGLQAEARGDVVNDAILLFLGGAERRLAGGALVLQSDAMQRRMGVDVDRSIAADADRQRLVTTMLGDAGFADFMKATRAMRDEYRLSDADLARFGLLVTN
ncbi:hypothetical protein [Roseicyclus sp.]|uniref:hypothetical protein n=1 Tax=Roseicyclus sp. TaxID=1914329 RepID=UPI003F6CF88B